MKKAGFILLAILPFFFMNINQISAQQKAVSGTEWDFLLGDWVGDGSGKPGEGNGEFTFKKDLRDNILVRKNHTAFPAMNGKPETIHDDLLIIYLDNSGALSKAIYFDNEGHVIHYVVTLNQTDKSVVFTSELQKNMPRFRLTYKALDSNSLDIGFEIAPPNQQDVFTKYITGKAHRKSLLKK